MDLKRFVQDLDDGTFIQMSLESLFMDEDGKQLLVTKFITPHIHNSLFKENLVQKVVSTIVFSFPFSHFLTVKFIWSEYAQLYEKDQK